MDSFKKLTNYTGLDSDFSFPVRLFLPKLILNALSIAGKAKRAAASGLNGTPPRDFSGSTMYFNEARGKYEGDAIRIRRSERVLLFV